MGDVNLMSRSLYLLERTPVLGGHRAGLDNLKERKISCVLIKLFCALQPRQVVEKRVDVSRLVCVLVIKEIRTPDYPVRSLAAVLTALSRALFICWR